MPGNQLKLTLPLKTSSGAWRLYSARQADLKFQPFAERVLRRDAYTCIYCGFQAQLHQQIINIDHNYTNNTLENLATACCFCAQCFFIESVGVGGYGGGTLIDLPEMSQIELNSLCHVLFCAITNDTGYKSSAQTIFLGLKMRSQAMESRFGAGSSDPAMFGHLLLDSGPHSTENMDRIFKNIRLLPSRAKFRTQVESWATSALKEISAETI